MSKVYAPTIKEDPNDAEIASHKLLLRAGFIRKSASGIYTFLPLGYRVLKKIEDIVRQEMDAIGAQEMLMPAMQPAEIWYESGRWNDYGPELMRLPDRHEREFCLGPTHEELITALIKNELNSYKQLPITMYQIQVKFRDEIRPRFGLLRGREFIMKDAYSFHYSQESLQETYDEMSKAYGNICDRLDLEYCQVEADSGQIGGKITTEFMALVDSGEAEICYCDCGYAVDTEAGECHCEVETHEHELEKVETPNVSSIQELAKFLNVSDKCCAKALCMKGEKGKIYLVFVPGDHELNDIKMSRIIGNFEFLDDIEMANARLVTGFIGPVGAPEDITIIADHNLKNMKKWICGANEMDYHLLGAELGKDFQIEQWEDLCTLKEGDICPKCGKAFKFARGIEVSQVFQLGTKYSESMNATYLDQNQKEQHFIMGCYGVGISRSLAVVVEQHSDENGIVWPASVAPAHVCILPLDLNKEDVMAKANEFAEILQCAGIEIAFDDRKERPGFKFADADLIGWPLQLIVGARSLANGEVEIKLRESGERENISADPENVLMYIKEKLCLK
ncbi:MAG: proline--tRNA ligase [Eggerthellaceae bacterium]|nr:proline--tRNA ligase [Eggerthellaceae bacterium]